MHNDACVLPIHPHTGLTALGFRANGRPIWPIKGGDGTDAGDSGGDGGSSDDGGGSNGATGWVPPATQSDFDRIIDQRLARERAKYADYDALKQKAQAHDALELELSSEAEKAARIAADEAYSAAMAKSVPRVVTAEFRAAAKGVLSGEQLDSLLEDIDLTRYADDDGEPDTAKIAAKIAKFAPKEDGKKKFPDLGGGNRGGNAKTTDMNALIRSAAGLSGG